MAKLNCATKTEALIVAFTVGQLGITATQTGDRTFEFNSSDLMRPLAGGGTLIGEIVRNQTIYHNAVKAANSFQ